MIIIPCPDSELRTLEQIFKHYSLYFNQDVNDFLEKDVKLWAIKLIEKQKKYCIKELQNAGCLCREEECIEVVKGTPLVKVK